LASEEEKEKGLVEKIEEKIEGMSLSPKKLAIWFILIILLVYTFGFALQPKYPKTPKDRGFKFGYKFDNGYVFVFSYNLEGQSDYERYNFVDNFDNVYSDLDLYILPKLTANVSIKLEFYDLVNKTLYVSVLNITKTVQVTSFEWKKVTIDMPHLKDKLYLAILKLDGEEIVRFNYRYSVLYEQVVTTVGELLFGQILYLVGGFIIILIGLFVAKGISNTHPLPDPDLKLAGYFFVIAGLILYYATKEVIFVYGLVNAAVFYGPAFIIAIFAGIYIVGKDSKKLILIKPAIENKTIEIRLIRYKEIDNIKYKTPSFVQFLLYRPQKVIYKAEWLFEGEGLPDKVIYFDKLDINKDIKIQATDIHKLEIEKYKRNVKHVETLAKVVKELRDQVDSLIIKLEKGEFERDLKFLSGLIGEDIYEPEKSGESR